MQTKGLIRWFYLIICMSLMACNQMQLDNQSMPQPKISTPSSAWLSLPLIPPAFAPPPFSASQILNITQAGQTHQLESLLQWDQKALDLIMLKHGRRLITIHYDGQKLDVQKDPLVPDSISGEQIMADIQLVYWPIDTLRMYLRKGYTLVDDGKERILLYDNTPIYRITYYTNDSRNTIQRQSVPYIRLVQLQYGYDMTIESTYFSH